MKVWCEECGSILNQEKEYSEMNEREKIFNHILNCDNKYNEDRGEYVIKVFDRYMKWVVEEQKKLAKEYEQMRNKQRLMLKEIEKDVIKDHQRWLKQTGKN